MPHLHLPAEHSDADLVLAANLADLVGSEDLYVAWTQETGAAIPEIEAVMRDERPGVLAELIGSIAAGVANVWHALIHGAAAPAPALTPAAVPPRAAGERSA
jgi:hypothetical protein